MTCDDAEAGPRTAILRNPARAYAAYRQMLLQYAVRSLVDYLQGNKGKTLQSMLDELGQADRETRWTNMGGQLIRTDDVTALRRKINDHELNSWDAIHSEYDRLWALYPKQKHQHALAVFRLLMGNDITAEVWAKALDESVNTQRYICDQVYATRAKDFDNPFRQTTFDDDEERDAVAGTIEDNDFVKQVRAETEQYERLVDSLRAKV